MAEDYSVADLVYLMKLCDQAERYEDMAGYGKQLVIKQNQLGQEERNLVSVCFKNAIGYRRTSWRVIAQIIQKEEAKESSKSLDLLKENKKKIEGELDNLCGQVQELLEKYLIKGAQTSEEQIFYLKMKGDYYRYMAEYSQGDALEKAKTAALEAYKEATALTQKELKSTNPIRLGLALNMSVFHYEILNEVQQACDIAKAAFDDAIKEIDQIDEDSYKDATAIMQLIRDNLTLWTSGGDQGEGDADPDEKNI